MALQVGIAETEEQRHACYQLRYEVNVAERRDGAFMCHKTRRVIDELDALSDIHYVRDGARVVGTARSIYFGNVVPPSYAGYFAIDALADLPRAQMNAVSRLVVEPAYRKSAVLPLLLDSTYNEGCSRGVRYSFMHCAPGLAHMYEALGYRFYRRGMAGTDVGWHVPMMLLTDDCEGLAKLGSPFAAWSRKYPEVRGRDAWFRERFPEFADRRTAIHAGAIDFIGRALAAAAIPERNAVTQHFLKLPAELMKQGYRRTVLLDCRAGDCLADSGDGFRDLVIQLAGTSSIVTIADDKQTIQARHAGAAIIEDFLRRGSDGPRLALRCEADSRFLVVPGRDLAERPRAGAGLPGHAPASEGAAAAGAGG